MIDNPKISDVNVGDYLIIWQNGALFSEGEVIKKDYNVCIHTNNQREQNWSLTGSYGYSYKPIQHLCCLCNQGIAKTDILCSGCLKGIYD